MSRTYPIKASLRASVNRKNAVSSQLLIFPDRVAVSTSCPDNKDAREAAVHILLLAAEQVTQDQAIASALREILRVMGCWGQEPLSAAQFNELKAAPVDVDDIPF